MRATLIAILLSLVALTAAAADRSKLWGNLEPGPYDVGFKVIETYDHSRPYRHARDLEGRPRSGERARPMQISIWYPAAKTSQPRMKFADYVALVASQDDFHPTDAAKRAAPDIFFGLFPETQQLTAAQRAQWLALDTAAVRNAAPVPNQKFPFIVWSLFAPALEHVSPEYLASHGYVVATMPRLGTTAGINNVEALDQDTKSRDIDFIIDELSRFAPADIHRLGITGFSAGGRWALIEAMRNPDLRAIVSLDSVMLFNDNGGKAMEANPVWDLQRVRVPILHMIRHEWVPQEHTDWWPALRLSERTYFDFTDPALEHLDFESAGYGATVVGGRAAKAAPVAAAFDAFNRYTLAFFDLHIKGDEKARALLAQTPAGVTAHRDAAIANPGPSVPEFIEAIREDGIDAALAYYRKAWKESGNPPFPENMLNVAAYQLLIGQRRIDDAIRLFTLNIEAFPKSANAHDSLADAYEAAGDKARALEEGAKVLAMLDADDTLNADRKKAVADNTRQRNERLNKK